MTHPAEFNPFPTSPPTLMAQEPVNTSMLEKCARQVAEDIEPGLEVNDKGLDPVTIITLIISVIQAIIQACPKPTKDVRESFKRPSLRQRAFVLLEARRNCDGTIVNAIAVNRSLLARASALSDPDANALINECRSQSNLLV